MHQQPCRVAEFTLIPPDQLSTEAIGLSQTSRIPSFDWPLIGNASSMGFQAGIRRALIAKQLSTLAYAIM